MTIVTQARNVLGSELETCCSNPVTGYYRDGKCNTGAGDYGAHVVCAQLTEEFLAFTQLQGNDLSTPVPEFNFPGLKAGDRWCLCASRWKESPQNSYRLSSRRRALRRFIQPAKNTDWLPTPQRR
jgi:uncharacterized protein